MPEPQSTAQESATAESNRRIRWDAVAAIIASLIGFLALLVAGYTAWVQRYTADLQRQQVRAQVWPYLIVGSDDLQSSLNVFNKGVGPALVGSLQLWIDGKPQRNWDHALKALGLTPHGIQKSPLDGNVLSPSDRITWIKFEDAATYKHFIAAYSRVDVSLCYCSTLGDCWVIDSRNPTHTPTRSAVSNCPRLPQAEKFED